MRIGLDITRHPCFNVSAKGSCARVHLPVAPECNIKCNYCNRKYDCVNESRPGVTSSVLTAKQAVLYLEQVLDQAPYTTVAGIAGPGDAFANPRATMETLRLIRERFPDLLLCLATNGLNVGPYIEDLASIDVTHVTVTLNAVDPEIGAKIYGWIRDGKVIYRGIDAARLLLSRQLDAIAGLKAAGMVVKVNTIVIQGVNDHHISDVARKVASLGADIQNCMVMYPNAGTPFAHIAEPAAERIQQIRNEAEKVIAQMKHCTRCRADAVGLLDQDQSQAFRECLSACSHALEIVEESRPYVAVATLEGMLVNQHLGEATQFHVWRETPNGYQLVCTRPAPAPGTGVNRWLALAETLRDCRAVLVSGIGETPRQILEQHHILPVEMSGFIQAGLAAIYQGKDVTVLKGRRAAGVCAKAAGCSGQGDGCG